MTKFAVIFFLFASVINNIEFNKQPLLNKQYVSIIATICEETTESDPCAGQEIYLILIFKKREVTITEKMVSSCGEERLQYAFKYKWKLVNKNEIKIYSEPEKIKYSALENLKLIIEDGIIYGIKNDGSKNSQEYIFSTVSN